MAAISGGLPKELLPVGGKPVLEWVLEEARDAGVDRVIAVVSREKPLLASYLRNEAELAYQEKANGHGAAVAVPDISDSVLVLNPDTIFFPSSPSILLSALVATGFDVALAVEEVPEDKVSQYGVVELSPSGRVKRILEKPAPGETKSRLAIAGRFALSAKAFAYLRKQVREYEGSGEISMTRILGQGVAAKYLKAAASLLDIEEERLDCGDPEGYAHAKEVVGEG
ncbi:MAG TPA: sugar phosphate nucleotidyltransferase [Fimbriimonadaceae bacterium]|jgi:UTP-glucose-1-phosphate uridylyltransferase